MNFRIDFFLHCAFFFYGLFYCFFLILFFHCFFLLKFFLIALARRIWGHKEKALCGNEQFQCEIGGNNREEKFLRKKAKRH